MTESKLIFQLTLNAKHEGETCALNQETVSDAIRTAIDTLLQDELVDDETQIQMSLYFNEFNYSDNLDSMRDTITESLTTLDSESLTQILEVINNG